MTALRGFQSFQTFQSFQSFKTFEAGTPLQVLRKTSVLTFLIKTLRPLHCFN